MLQPLLESNRSPKGPHSVPFSRTLGALAKRSHLSIILVLALVISLQIILYSTNLPSENYCKLPNLGVYKRSCSLDDYNNLPTIYVITPTYSRHVQISDLTSISHALMLIPKIHWIIVEDSETKTLRLERFIGRLQDQFDFRNITHLNQATPGPSKGDRQANIKHRPKGVWQRNKALAWIRGNIHNLDRRGVIYFADDDNTYDAELFNEMRYTRRVSVWPVAFAGGLLVERPICRKGKVVGFNARYSKSRRFPIDMAGFAVSIGRLTSKPNATFSDDKIGQIESEFLKLVADSWEDLEPKADCCRRVLVWHTKTRPPSVSLEKPDLTSSVFGTDF